MKKDLNINPRVSQKYLHEPGSDMRRGGVLGRKGNDGGGLENEHEREIINREILTQKFWNNYLIKRCKKVPQINLEKSEISPEKAE